MELEMDT